MVFAGNYLGNWKPVRALKQNHTNRKENVLLKQLKGQQAPGDLYWWASKWLVLRSSLVIVRVFQVLLGLCPEGRAAYSAAQSFPLEREQQTWEKAHLRVTRGVGRASQNASPSPPLRPWALPSCWPDDTQPKCSARTYSSANRYFCRAKFRNTSLSLKLFLWWSFFNSA